jgi:negative regulator of flagellin synthesis FlgM
MKISDDKSTQDLSQYIKQTPDTQKATPSQINANKNRYLSGEKVAISEKAGDLNKIGEIVRKTPDVRTEKVELLREKIVSGSYNVSGQEIADKMLREYLLEDALNIQI